jgi:diacylglycerol kinase family enzyme
LKLGPGHIITNASDIYKKWSISVPEDRRPLMVFINKRSGGQVGKLIAQRLSRVLNPNQIIDLSQGGPMPMLKVMQRLKVPYRILACGGDGTAAWLLSALDKLIEKGAAYVPPVAVLPLGTGNDLARVLGWGGGYDNEAMAPICAKIEAGHEVLLDRWRLDIENVGIVDGVKHPKIMNNYFSLGIDAKIALDFHRKREANPSQFKSRGMNKVIYAGLGAGAIFDGCANLSKVLQVELDGQLVVLPKSLEGIMVLNLSSWAGGKNPWGKPARSEGRAAQSPCDGLFELIGVTGSFHMGQIQTYMNDGIRLGQGRDVTFRWLTTDILPVQLDGEPWEEPQSIIRVSFHRQSRMIASPSENVWDKSQWLDPLPFTSPSGEKTPSPKRSPKANPDELIEIDPTIASSSNATDKPKKKSKKGKKPSPLTSSTGSLQTGDLIQLDPSSTAISEDAAASSSAVLDLTMALEPLTIAEAQLDAPPRLPKKKRSAATSDPALPVLDVLELSGSEALKRSQEAPASTHPATDAPLDQLDF